MNYGIFKLRKSYESGEKMRNTKNIYPLFASIMCIFVTSCVAVDPVTISTSGQVVTQTITEHQTTLTELADTNYRTVKTSGKRDMPSINHVPDRSFRNQSGREVKLTSVESGFVQSSASTSAPFNSTSHKASQSIPTLQLTNTPAENNSADLSETRVSQSLSSMDVLNTESHSTAEVETTSTTETSTAETAIVEPEPTTSEVVPETQATTQSLFYPGWPEKMAISLIEGHIAGDLQLNPANSSANTFDVDRTFYSLAEINTYINEVLTQMHDYGWSSYGYVGDLSNDGTESCYVLTWTR